MSLITVDPDKSPRDCTRKRHGSSRRKRAVIIAASTTLLVLGIIILLWLTLLLRPSNPPHFSLLAATVTASDNGSVIVIFSVGNPNAHAAALYEQLQVNASFAGIPLGGSLPPLEQQAAEGDVLMSALLKSSSSSSSPATTEVKKDGAVRWKVANWWVSGRHALAVVCAFSSVQGWSQCNTHVL
ncbi:hypothetical protein PR202_gb05928 [Eleusine coracana subsp. coracana]|uniref:Late embryogenesis abundant protein LEA-2 subgroup domain-containing protein n=1 Tax=Eleusine coracana subsp. coracana TaxID=191504 RepID=A0AAV5E5S7_ELECO|nr:hypothetical protein QOZ80_2BG0151890 [Eleusine coracana subsp. coracana]GJN18734.1 hypothetical protein PR202_gb05928 [Eleusine coracana subsp. coracana]